MKKMKYTIIAGLVFTSVSAFADTATTDKTPPPYGDNPNIFVVLGHKAKDAVQNTANKVGAATERGIQKIKPKVENTWDNTKTYTEEQATIAKENTIKAKDSAVKKMSDTKDKVFGGNTPSAPIEQGQLSQSSSSNVPTAVASAPIQNAVQAPMSTPTPSIQSSTPSSSGTTATESNQPAPAINTSKDNPIGGSDSESDYPH